MSRESSSAKSSGEKSSCEKWRVELPNCYEL